MTSACVRRLAESACGSTCVDVLVAAAPSSSSSSTQKLLVVDKHTEMTRNRAVANAALKELDVLLTMHSPCSTPSSSSSSSSSSLPAEQAKHQTPSCSTSASHIVALRGYHLEGTRLHVLQEYCASGDLFHISSRESRELRAGQLRAQSGVTTSERGLQRVFRQIVRGVAQLHARGVAHLDLSLENVFLTAKMDARIGDFAHSVRFTRGRDGRVVPQELPWEAPPKAAYAAPELCQPENARVDVTKADAWAVGVMLWHLVTRTPLVRVASMEDARFRGMQTRGTWWALEQTQRLTGVSWVLRDFLCRLLHTDPAKRLSIADALQHRWLQMRPPMLSPLCPRSPPEVRASCIEQQRPCPEMASTTKRMRSQSSHAAISLDKSRIPIR